MIDAHTKDSVHLQRIYKRRKITDEGFQSTLSEIVSRPNHDFKNINRIG